jgi:hypothetical protein
MLKHQQLQTRMAALQSKYDVDINKGNQKAVMLTRQLEEHILESKNKNSSAYKAYVQATIASEKVTPSALLKMKAYQKLCKVNQKQHKGILKQLKTSPKGLAAMVVPDGPDNKTYDSDCVVCLDAEKSVVILDCMHVAFCEDCAETCGIPGQECPLCSRKIRKTAKIFF